MGNLLTKRLVIGQVTVCRGCCCGALNRGKPEVPVDWLKMEWRTRGLLRNVQLTISGCLGPCDLPNVVRISSAISDIWLGNLGPRHYAEIVHWACRSKVAGMLLPLGDLFEQHSFNPFSGTGLRGAGGDGHQCVGRPSTPSSGGASRC
jgi:hypothetical protein